MAQDAPLHFVVMVGSLRKGSYNAAIARALPALAPDGVTIAPLGSVGDFRHYDHDVQVRGLSARRPRNGRGDREGRRRHHRDAREQPLRPGVLKNAIDWMSRLPNQPFAGKPVAIESASHRPLRRSLRAQHHLRQMFV